MKEKLKVGATVEVERINKEGKTVDKRVIHNTVVNGGFDLVCDLLGKQTSRPTQLSHIAVGTNSATTTTSMTALGSQWGSRVAGTYAHTTGTTTFTLSCTIPEHTGASVNLTESGVFNAATSGTMFNRVTFATVGKEASDTIVIRYIINLVDQ